jgi:tetratricopeptide (TPR) repeat protein
VLILRYSGTEKDSEIEGEIIQPMAERGLIDRLEDAGGAVRYTAHPLMKLAYSTWLEPDERSRAHEQWARAAAAAPGLFLKISTTTSVEELQPLIDATSQYLAAGNWGEAWNIYESRGLGSRLGYLGYLELSLSLARKFEDVPSKDNKWSPSNSIFLFDRLGWLANSVDNTEEALRYRRKELAVAREGQLPWLPDVERIVATTLAKAGLVRESTEVLAKSQSKNGTVALAQGHYAEAAKLLRSQFNSSIGHDRTVAAQHLAEALYRDAKFEPAKLVLDEALELSKRGSFACCQRAIMSQLIELSLRTGNVMLAQTWANEYRALRQRLELPNVDHFWLLLEEDNFDGALSVVEHKKDGDPASSIAKHVHRARIFVRAKRFLEATKELAAADAETLYQRLCWLTHGGFPNRGDADSRRHGGFAPCQQRRDYERTIRPRSFGRWPGGRRTSTRAGGFCRWLR